MIDPIDHSLAFGRQTGQNQRHRSPQIGRHHRSPLEPIDPRHAGHATLDLDICAHTHKFGRVHETVFKNCLLQHTFAICGTHQGHELRLQVGGVSGEWCGCNING